MKKAVILLLFILQMAGVRAEEYSYLTFETTDGAIVSVPVSSLTLTIGEGTLTAGDNVFTLSELTKMYFSTADMTGIGELSDSSEEAEIELFTTDGLSLGKYKRMGDATGALKKGVYLVKHNHRTFKIAVK